MSFRDLVLNDAGRLRSGYRLALFAAAFVALYLLFGAAAWVGYAFLDPVLRRLPHYTYFQDLIFRVLLLGSALLGGYLCTRLIEGLPWRAMGLTFHRRWFRQLAIGSAIGLISLAIAVGIASLGHGFHFNLSTQNLMYSVGRTLLSSALLFIVAALAEEALFRGYPLQTLCRPHLAWLGLLLTSVPFAMVHLGNPNVVPYVTFTNTALAGIWLGVAYLRTRSLWLPLGVHWSWNWALGSLFGLPVSGLRIVSSPLLEATDLGPAWLTGGNYGIEGGAACTIALILSTLIIWRMPWVSPDPELLRLTSNENPVVHQPAISIRPVEEHS